MYLIEILTRELSKKIKISKENFIFPSKEGDISCNICFIRNKDNPQKLAEQICSEIKLPEEFEKVESKNGYLNFYIDYSKINLDIKPKKINLNLASPWSTTIAGSDLKKRGTAIDRARIVFHEMPQRSDERCVIIAPMSPGRGKVVWWTSMRRRSPIKLVLFAASLKPVVIVQLAS